MSLLVKCTNSEESPCDWSILGLYRTCYVYKIFSCFYLQYDKKIKLGDISLNMRKNVLRFKKFSPLEKIGINFRSIHLSVHPSLHPLTLTHLFIYSHLMNVQSVLLQLWWQVIRMWLHIQNYTCAYFEKNVQNV